MNATHLISAISVVLVGASAVAQEATPDTWTQVPAVTSVEQVRAELGQARKDGTIKAWSAGYIEKSPAVKSRQEVRDETLAARRSGELNAIGSEAYAFTPPAAPSTSLARNR